MNDFEKDLEHNIQQLHILAWGDLDIVEDALKESLEKVRPIWWKFWQSDWRINFKAAAEYIIDHRKKLENIQSVDHDSIASK